METTTDEVIKPITLNQQPLMRDLVVALQALSSAYAAAIQYHKPNGGYGERSDGSRLLDEMCKINNHIDAITMASCGIQY
jgi:hypothetical protein